MTIEILRDIIALTILSYMIGAFLGDSFKPKDWHPASKIALLGFYLAIIIAIISNHTK